MRVTGVEGVLTVGYQEAASLGAWSLSGSGHSFTVDAVVRSADSFWVTQRPMTLRLRVGACSWIWNSVDPPGVGPRVTITVAGRPRMVKE